MIFELTLRSESDLGFMAGATFPGLESQGVPEEGCYVAHGFVQAQVLEEA